jgi:DsbC/DsbD-like thiol-disulfide interchange protein
VQTSTPSAFRRVLTLTTAPIFLALTILLACARAGHLDAAVTSGTSVEANGDGVRTLIALSASSSSSGHKLGVEVSLEIAPGWHIYGAPLPEGESLTSTSIKFDSDLLARQTINLPKPTPLHFELLNQTYPVYTGSVKAVGDIVLKQKIKPGDYSIPGTLNFQRCNDSMCEPPQSVHFELSIKID